MDNFETNTIEHNNSFIAMEYYFGVLNRTYQVFITPTLMAGAYVYGLMADPGMLLNYWFVPSSYVNQKMLERYDGIPVESDHFKRISPLFNFQYLRSDIQKTSYDPTLKWGMGSIAHSGKLTIHLENGRKREFILLGLQQGYEIVQHLKTSSIMKIEQKTESEINKLIRQVYNEPINIELWKKLADQFHIHNEKAQEAFCRIYLNALQRSGID